MSFFLWFINMILIIGFICVLKVFLSRGGGGGKFLELDGRISGFFRGGGGGGRKLFIERKYIYVVNMDVML